MRLVVARGPEPVGPFELRPGANYLGRDPACEVHLPSKRVSRKHAVAFVSASRLTLKDNGSANGLYDEGGHRCEVLELGPGQRVQVGDYVLRFEVAEVEEDVELDVDDPLTAEDDLLIEEDEEFTPVRHGPVPVPREPSREVKPPPRPHVAPAPLLPSPVVPDPGRLTMDAFPSPIIGDAPTAETSMRMKHPALPFGPPRGGFGAFADPSEESAERSRSDIRPIAPSPPQAPPPPSPAARVMPAPPPPYVPSAPAVTPAPPPPPFRVDDRPSTSESLPTKARAPSRRGLNWMLQAALVLLASTSILLCAPFGGLVANWRGAVGEAEELSLLRGEALADALANRNANALAENRGIAYDTSFVTQQAGVREAMLADKNGTVLAPVDRVRTSIARSEAFVEASENHALTRVESDGGSYEILAPVRAEVAVGAGARTIVGWAWIRYDPSVVVDEIASPWLRVLTGLMSLGAAVAVLLAGGWWLFVRPLQALRDETEFAMKGDVERVESPVPFFALDQLADSINRAIRRQRER